MAHHCHKCGNELGVRTGERVGRSETCDSCDSDLHCCLNCKFYDESAHNSCREPQSDRVLDKDRRNYCDYMTFVEGPRGHSGRVDTRDYLKSLDSLFKK